MKTNRNFHFFESSKNISAKKVQADPIDENKREISKILKGIILISGLILINSYIVFAVYLITKM